MATSSPRRAAQLLAARPDLRIVDIRGNVDTRLRKLAAEGLDALVLAVAGLERLGLGDRIAEALPTALCLPAVGQGALAVQCRADDARARAVVAALDDPATRAAVEAERGLLAALGGGCKIPIAGYAVCDGDRLRLDGLVAAPDGSRLVRDALVGLARRARGARPRAGGAPARGRRREPVGSGRTPRALKDLCTKLQPRALLATNTSSISITKLAAATDRPDRFIGMHFFNPVPLMALLELIRGLQTSDDTHAKAEAFAKRVGKVAITAKNSPGFAVNRILCPMINEAIFALQEGIATAEDLDAGMKLGCNHPIGPLALADMIGLDTMLSVMEVFYEGFNDPKYRPAPLLKEMVAAGHLGRKTGQGFYSYGK